MFFYRCFRVVLFAKQPDRMLSGQRPRTGCRKNFLTVYKSISGVLTFVYFSPRCVFINNAFMIRERFGGLIDLLFHMTPLINRNNAKIHHAKQQPIVRGN